MPGITATPLVDESMLTVVSCGGCGRSILLSTVNAPVVQRMVERIEESHECDGRR